MNFKGSRHQEILMTPSTLRRLVKEKTGQDVYKCQGCLDCELPSGNDADIPLGSLIQMIIHDDREVLSCRTLWSDDVLKVSRFSCLRGLNIESIILALREEAIRRGVD
jgi:heterodisulfide reductase subunit C